MISSVVTWPMGCTDNTLIVALFTAPAALVQHCDIVG